MNVKRLTCAVTVAIAVAYSICFWVPARPQATQGSLVAPTVPASQQSGQQKFESSHLEYWLYERDIEQALTGAWARVLAELAHARMTGPAKAVYSMPKGASERFLGFVEGLLRVSIPADFSQNVSHAELWWNGHMKFPFLRYSPWLPDEFPIPEDVPNLKVYIDDEFVNVSVATGNFPTVGDDGFIQLPETLSNHLIERSDGGFIPVSSAVFIEERVFLAIPSGDQPGGQLLCLSVRDGEVIWSMDMKRYGGDEYRGAVAWFTQIRVTSSNLVLFHCCNSSIAIEGFSFEGERRFAFSTFDVTDQN